MPAAFSWLRADPAAVGEDREGKGWGMLLPSKAQAALESLELLVCSVRYVFGAGLGPYDMGEMVLRKLCKGVCAHTCVFSRLCKVCFFLLPKSLEETNCLLRPLNRLLVLSV